MQSANHPLNEQKRISALRDTGLLDSPAEGMFDAITHATAKLFDMPISLVCLVDAERVWLKSSSGIEGVSEIHRNIGFCPHTIIQKDVFEVKNASQDERFCNSPLVSNAPHFLYYAGAPLITNDGFALGTLCVMDYQARELNDEQKAILKSLAKTTTALIEAKRQENIYKQTENYQLGAIVEMSPNEVFLVDIASNKISYANRTAQLNVGCSLANLKQLTWNEIITHAPVDLINHYLQTNKSFFSAPIKFEAIHTRVDGSTYPADCQIQANGPSNHEFIIISRDISERIDAENREKTLQRDIIHINRINTASALSSGLAHELNQPLTAISQYCSTALSLMENTSNIDPMITDSLQKTTTQAIRAGEIIKRFRAFTERRQPTRSSIDITQLLDETILLLKHEIKKHQIEVNLEHDASLPMLNADPIQVQQVLLNLLTNSIQALHQNKDGQIDVSYSLNTENLILFTISDNGPGIGKVLFDDLTTPSHSNKTNGTGLGLSICKFIVNSHAGKIWHDKNYTDGMRIHFTIPAIVVQHESA